MKNMHEIADKLHFSVKKTVVKFIYPEKKLFRFQQDWCAVKWLDFDVNLEQQCPNVQADFRLESCGKVAVIFESLKLGRSKIRLIMKL